jgi:UDP-N-acetylglucosamine--N-acetylmuramyl-(pentapeptide) pyrophosphoryl-undecaprenol N-acetylglucosamine transferase
LIAGGGTGGHLYPALAVARAFRGEEPDGAVLVVGRAGGPEERLVPAAGFDLETVSIRGLDRDAPWKNVALPYLVPTALLAGLRIVDRFKPDVLHEKDVRPGLATRIFAGGAAAVCTTLPGTEKRLRAHRVVLTGVPVREGFVPRTPDIPPRRLLITGGSQGALRLNGVTWSVLAELCARFEEVIHVAGHQGAAGIARHARDRYTGLTFTDDMPSLMARADLIVSRAGVSTIAEAAAVGLPMILVPGRFGGGHQVENAAAMVEAGAAVSIADTEFTGSVLLQALDRLDSGRLRTMAKASRAAGRMDAARRVLAVLREVSGK